MAFQPQHSTCGFVPTSTHTCRTPTASTAAAPPTPCGAPRFWPFKHRAPRSSTLAQPLVPHATRFCVASHVYAALLHATAEAGHATHVAFDTPSQCPVKAENSPDRHVPAHCTHAFPFQKLPGAHARSTPLLHTALGGHTAHRAFDSPTPHAAAATSPLAHWFAHAMQDVPLNMNPASQFCTHVSRSAVGCCPAGHAVHVPALVPPHPLRICPAAHPAQGVHVPALEPLHAELQYDPAPHTAQDVHVPALASPHPLRKCPAPHSAQD